MESIMSETTGQRHTKENCNTCGVELTDNNWNISWKKTNRTQCQDCNNPNRETHNPNRMYVNGQYISKYHPLYKSGRYKGFTDAAFSSLSNYEQSLEGEVYIIYSPSFPSWVKIGMAIDSKDRLKQYQTGSPYRDYRVHACYPVSDRRKSEAEAHELLSQNHERKGEWFVCSTVVAETILNKHFNTEGVQFELF